MCEFFDNPFVLAAYELPPTVYTLANSAVKEMRRYYSRKVIDVLIKITRQSIDALRKKFCQESGELVALYFTNLSRTRFRTGDSPIFEVHAILMIPSIVIRPDINELQDTMTQAGKMMVGVAKGVGQWSGNRKTKVRDIKFEGGGGRRWRMAYNGKRSSASSANHDTIRGINLFDSFGASSCVFVCVCCPRVCLRVRVSFVFLPAGVGRKTLETAKERLQRA